MTPVTGATGKFLFHAARRPLPLAVTIQGCFPFCRSEARLHVLVSVVFGPLVEMDQSVPQANRVDSETNPGRERMYRLALGVITVGLRLDLSWKHENRWGGMMFLCTDRPIGHFHTSNLCRGFNGATVSWTVMCKQKGFQRLLALWVLISRNYCWISINLKTEMQLSFLLLMHSSLSKKDNYFLLLLF